MKASMTRLFVAALSLIVLIASTGIVAAANYDFNGETVTIVRWYEPQPDYFTEGGIAEGRLEEAEKLFNVNIEFIYPVYDTYIESFMTRSMSGASENDIWMVLQRHFWPLVAQGAVFPVSSVLPDDYYDHLDGASREVALSMTYNGNTYAFGSYHLAALDMSIVIWNKDLFAREGLPDLYDLVESGEWTWEKMTEIAIAATRDLDGDQQTDQWGIAAYPPSLVTDLALSAGGAVTKEDETGRIVFAFDDDIALASLAQVYQWAEVDKVLIDNYMQMFIDGKVAMQVNYPGGLVWSHPMIAFDYGIVPVPLSPYNIEFGSFANPIHSHVLPANVKNPEALVALFDFLWTPDDVVQEVDKTFSQIVRDRESYNYLWFLHDEAPITAFDFEQVLGPWGNMEQPFMRGLAEAISGQKSPSAAMAGIKPAVQAILDDLFSR